jgi:hypothetical protein
MLRTIAITIAHRVGGRGNDCFKPFKSESLFRSSRPVRCGSPTLGRFDSGAAPFAEVPADAAQRLVCGCGSEDEARWGRAPDVFDRGVGNSRCKG